MLFDLPAGNSPASIYLARPYKRPAQLIPQVEVKKLTRPQSSLGLRQSGSFSPDKDKINFEESELLNILDNTILSTNADSKPLRPLTRPRSRHSAALPHNLAQSNQKLLSHPSIPSNIPPTTVNPFRSSVQGVSIQPPNIKDLKTLSSLLGMEEILISPGQFLSETAVPPHSQHKKPIGVASNTTPDFTIVKRSISPFIDLSNPRKSSKFEFVDAADHEQVFDMNGSRVGDNAYNNNIIMRSQTSMANVGTHNNFIVSGTHQPDKIIGNESQVGMEGEAFNLMGDWSRRAQSSMGMRQSNSRAHFNSRLIDINSKNSENHPHHINKINKENFGPAEITKLEIFMKINSLQKEQPQKSQKKKKNLKKAMMENLLIEKKETTPSKIIEKYHLNNPKGTGNFNKKDLNGVTSSKQYFCVVNHDVTNKEPFKYLKITATKAQQNVFSSRKLMRKSVPFLNTNKVNETDQ